MSIDYSTLLTPQQKREILSGRISQFAGEAYQYTLNLKTAESVGTEEQIESIKKSIEVLEAAIKVHQDELAELAELAELVLGITGSSARIVRHPLPQDDPKQRQPDISLARETLGWEPSVDLRQGLERTVAYFEKLLSLPLPAR